MNAHKGIQICDNEASGRLLLVIVDLWGVGGI
jgi:hypothetical protein